MYPPSVKIINFFEKNIVVKKKNLKTVQNEEYQEVYWMLHSLLLWAEVPDGWLEGPQEGVQEGQGGVRHGCLQKAV